MNKKDKIELISEQMFAIGQKYAAIAMEAESNKATMAALRVAEKAYSMVIKTEPEKVSDVTLKFIDGLEGKKLRAEVWREYLDWCYSQDLVPVPKGEFFSKMKNCGFKFKAINGYVAAIPPKLLGR